LKKNKSQPKNEEENEETVDDLPKQAQEMLRNAISKKRDTKRARGAPVGVDQGEEKTAKQKRARDKPSSHKEGDKQLKAAYKQVNREGKGADTEEIL
jgi:hypothetical protein